MAQKPVKVELDRENRKNKISNFNELYQGIKNLNDEILNLVIGDVGNINFSPKGAYDTLANLESAYPNGEKGIYLVKENNSWYYYSEGKWTLGGIYQSENMDDYLTEDGERWVI